MIYRPPFEINDEILMLLSKVSHLWGLLKGSQKGFLSPQLRREKTIQTLHASLAIEGNTLSLEQVMAVIEGKRVDGKEKEIREVLNAYDV